MTADGQKRSSISGITASDDRAGRVGGRQGDQPGPPGGGGYQDICTPERSGAKDPRLDELRAVGLQRHWLRVAEQIGVDRFLLTWQTLDEADAVRDDCGRVHIPSYASWIRLQRNKLIASLARRGLEAQEIQQELMDRLGYDLTVRYIKKLMRGAE